LEGVCFSSKERTVSILSWYRGIRQRHQEKKIQKQFKILTNPRALREERQAAIEFFSHLQASEAVPGLLKRFEFTLEHGINDVREKESCMTGIVKFGEEAVPYVMEHLKDSLKISWPIKVLLVLVPRAKVPGLLIQLLDFSEISFDQAKIDKNYDILCYLMDEKIDENLTLLLPFMKDSDERVRVACAEVFLNQEKEEWSSYLAPFLTLEGEDHYRLCRRIAEGFAQHKWLLPEGLLQDGPFLDDFIVEKRLIHWRQTV
jgi:hypothetical protein